MNFRVYPKYKRTTASLTGSNTTRLSQSKRHIGVDKHVRCAQLNDSTQETEVPGASCLNPLGSGGARRDLNHVTTPK